MAEVYPRVHGGTRLTAAFSESLRGLSPRARGNPHEAGVDLLCDRSIPACTGEPPTR